LRRPEKRGPAMSRRSWTGSMVEEPGSLAFGHDPLRDSGQVMRQKQPLGSSASDPPKVERGSHFYIFPGGSHLSGVLVSAIPPFRMTMPLLHFTARRRRLKFPNQPGCTRISGISFQKIRLQPLGCVGSARLALLPDNVGQREVEAVFPPHRISGKKIPENRAAKLHIGKAASSASRGMPTSRSGAWHDGTVRNLLPARAG
jgi:hypothetical protein